MSKTIIYSRVSTQEQSERGTSLDSQLATCQKHAADKGYKVLGEFRDDLSGMTPLGQRPGLSEALQSASQLQAEILLVYDVDRLARDELVSMLIVKDFEDIGARVEFAVGGNTANVDDRLLIGIKRVIADYDRRKIIFRMTGGKYSRVANEGVVLNSHVSPYGYSYDEENRTLAIDDLAVDVVRFIYKRYTSGKVSLAGLQLELEAAGYPTSADLNPTLHKKSAHGKWNRTSIRKIIQNPVYKGQWTFGKLQTSTFEPAVVEVPSVVSEKLWQKANDQLEENRSNRPHSAPYPLKGKVRCNLCGNTCRRKIVKGSKRKYVYYYCNLESCESKAYKGERLELAVAEWVLYIAASPEELQREIELRQKQSSKDTAPIQKTLGTLISKIEKETTALGRLADTYAYGTISEGQLKTRTDSIRARLYLLEQQRIELEVQLAPVPDIDLEVLRELFTGEWYDRFEELQEYVAFSEKKIPAFEEILSELYARLGLSVRLGKDSAELSCSLTGLLPTVHHVVITFQGKTPTNPCAYSSRSVRFRNNPRACFRSNL